MLSLVRPVRKNKRSSNEQSEARRVPLQSVCREQLLSSSVAAHNYASKIISPWPLEYLNVFFLRLQRSMKCPFDAESS